MGGRGADTKKETPKRKPSNRKEIKAEGLRTRIITS
jgi:hypothetical protein